MKKNFIRRTSALADSKHFCSHSCHFGQDKCAKDSRSHPQPENRLCSSSVSPGRLERLPGKTRSPPLNQLSEWELMLWNWI